MSTELGTLDRETEILGPQQLAVIVMGSEKDRSHADEITKVLQSFGIQFELHIASAHKTPEHALDIVKSYNQEGEEEGKNSQRQVVFIAVAGRSNALGGCIDANSSFPVINCPPPGEWYDVFSSLRMPSGVAGSVIINPDGAALETAKIFALSNPALVQKIEEYQAQNRKNILKADTGLRTYSA